MFVRESTSWFASLSTKRQLAATAVLFLPTRPVSREWRVGAAPGGRYGEPINEDFQIQHAD